MTIRIGHKMRWAADIVRNNPGCNICFVADIVGPRGSRAFGYAIVHRAIKAGLISYTKTNGRYKLEAVS